ncbi:unnamed protein product, partial [Allacma fusca]
MDNPTVFMARLLGKTVVCQNSVAHFHSTW